MSARSSFAWFLAAADALLLTALGALRYSVHRNFVDFGIFSQTASSAFGCFCNQIEGSHWAFHFSPMLYLVGAVVWAWRSPFALIALQAVGGALTIPPIYGLVARHAEPRVAQLCAIVVALYPALAGLAFNDFHENGFAPAAVAWMLWAADGGYIVAACILAAIVLCVKEDQAVFLAVAGFLGAWRYRGTALGRASLGVALASIIVFVAFFTLIQPHATANGAWAPVRFYSWSMNDVRALPIGLLARAGFFVLAFGPLLFLPFRSRMMLLAVVPLAEVLLSRMSTTYTLGSHYAGAWIGYVLVAFAYAIRTVPAAQVKRMLFACIAVCAIELAVANPLHPGMNLRPVQNRDLALDRFLSSLPPELPVATQEEAFTHLALTNSRARLLPEDERAIPESCYALIDVDYPTSVILIEYGATFERLVRSGIYLPARRDGGITLYRRASCAS